MDRKTATAILNNFDHIKAFASGQVIQHNDCGRWCDRPNPSFTDTPDNYRIKPRPAEGWVNVYEDGDFGGLHSTKALAEAAIVPGVVARTVFMREVET